MLHILINIHACMHTVQDRTGQSILSFPDGTLVTCISFHFISFMSLHLVSCDQSYHVISSHIISLNQCHCHCHFCHNFRNSVVRLISLG